VFARRIAVIGAGYVGLTTGACLASLGHRVVCADIDARKVERLRRGEVDILEPGLPELVGEGLAAGRLRFVVGARAAVAADDGAAAEIVFLCVPTPMGEGGAADLRSVQAVVDEVGALLPAGCVVVNKSTVPVGTAATTAAMLGRDDVAVVSNPEFLREGSAVHDFLHPDRIVVGSGSQSAAERVAALYARLGAPTQLTDAASAEMVKYAANCFLAMKLSYVNALAGLCERLGADVAEVTEGMGYDRRIGKAFLSPGPGWGGSCFPKDTHALLQIAEGAGVGFELIAASLRQNDTTRALVVDKVRAAAGGSLAGPADRAARADVQGRHRRPARLPRARRRRAAAGRGRRSWRPTIPAHPRVRPRRHGRHRGGRRPAGGGEGGCRAGGADRLAAVPHARLVGAGRRDRHPRGGGRAQPARRRHPAPRRLQVDGTGPRVRLRRGRRPCGA
jgi:UDPglucose 6-dehydrogenase